MEANRFFQKRQYWLDPDMKRLPPPMFFQSEFEKSAFLKNRMEESLMKSAFRFYDNHREASERCYKQQVNFMHHREFSLRSRATPHDVILKYAGTPHPPREVTLEKTYSKFDSKDDEEEFVSILMPRVNLMPKEKQDKPTEKSDCRPNTHPATKNKGLRGSSAPFEKKSSPRRAKTAIGIKHQSRPVTCHPYGQSSPQEELQKHIQEVLEQKEAEKVQKKPIDCNAAAVKVKEELDKTIVDTSKFVKELRREAMLESLLQPQTKKKPITQW